MKLHARSSPLQGWRSPARRHGAEQADVAVLYFNNSAHRKGRTRSWQPLTKGIADLLIGELAANPASGSWSATQIQKILDEQKLTRDGTSPIRPRR